VHLNFGIEVETPRRTERAINIERPLPEPFPSLTPQVCYHTTLEFNQDGEIEKLSVLRRSGYQTPPFALHPAIVADGLPSLQAYSVG
jgi:hypothetical protein